MQDSSAFFYSCLISEESGNVFKEIREKHAKLRIKLCAGRVHFGYMH